MLVVVQKQINIQIHRSEITQIKQLIIQCDLVVDEAENNDDVHDEMQQHDADEMVEKHNVIVG